MNPYQPPQSLEKTSDKTGKFSWRRIAQILVAIFIFGSVVALIDWLILRLITGSPPP